MLDKKVSNGILKEICPDNFCIKKDVGFCSYTGRPKFEIQIFNNARTEYLTLKGTQDSINYTLKGNLRKWTFGKFNAFQDLNFGDYVKAINLIAKRLGVDVGDLWNFEITSLELGGNIRLKPEFLKFTNCLVSYPRLKKMNYNSQTIYFLGTKYKIKIYDKLKEVCDKKFKGRKHITRKILKNNGCIRIEKTITSKSGTVLRERIKTLGVIKENWEFLVDDWLDTIYKIEIVDKFSSLKKDFVGELTPRKFEKLLASLTVENIDIDELLQFVNDNANTRKKECRSLIYALHDNNTSRDRRQSLTHILSTAALKAGKMKSRKPQVYAL